MESICICWWKRFRSFYINKKKYIYSSSRRGARKVDYFRSFCKVSSFLWFILFWVPHFYICLCENSILLGRALIQLKLIAYSFRLIITLAYIQLAVDGILGILSWRLSRNSGKSRREASPEADSSGSLENLLEASYATFWLARAINEKFLSLSKLAL